MHMSGTAMENSAEHSAGQWLLSFAAADDAAAAADDDAAAADDDAAAEIYCWVPRAILQT